MRRTWVTRATAAIGLTAAMAAAPLACSSSGASGGLPAGYVAGAVFGVPACCEDGTSVQLPSDDCPRLSCPNGVAYAFCSSGSFGGCTCTQPSQNVVPVEAAAGPMGCPPEASNADVVRGTRVGPPEAGGPFVRDSALFEAASGDCVGAVAEAIPSSQCGSCTGPVAFALCDGVLYSECSCTLPPGYTLLDAGRYTGAD